MPNIATALKQEITRLARKELRQETDWLRKVVASNRHQLAEVKRRVDELERQQKRSVRDTPKHQDMSTREAPLRFRAAGFAQHRRRLRLSAREMGLLVHASAMTVYKWEKGEAKPRAKNLQAIAAVRKMGKREALHRLQELTVDA